ncbi:hypothetical protein KIN20_004178 [Parelaphostrongylus tenuis]|uniref:Uncharacterized protein n=1 Tax=Parelaphostrongylus tenuis TaxID=148309 RepID=A0AAD5MGM5_PARTN|nr:hypothetical protein KIN20_004178 [Parelaphostrongylus tenuis]
MKRHYEAGIGSELPAVWYEVSVQEFADSPHIRAPLVPAKLSPYCEIYANQLLKDAEYVPIHGIDAVVMQRFQANMAYDIAMNNLSKNKQEENFKPSSSSEQPQTSSTSTLQTLLNAMPSPTTENTGGLRESGYKASRAKCDTNRIPNENCMDIEVIKCVKATEMVSEALRTSTFETHCMICKTLTPSEYVLRKLHVSLSHMNKDHTHSDYVEILSDLMKKAYPTLPNNDLQVSDWRM